MTGEAERGGWCALLAAGLLVLSPASAQADPLAPGGPFPELKLMDQHERPARLDRTSLATVVFAAERKPGDWAQTIIDQTYRDAVASGRLAVILDVSRMPSVITRLVAMPSFRDRRFPIALAHEGAAVADLPRRPGAVTVFRVAAGRVAAIDYANDQESLARLLAADR
jgi:hypothetical protein